MYVFCTSYSKEKPDLKKLETNLFSKKYIFEEE